MADHGPQGGDEINIIRPGRDYGWPDVSYGRQYDARRTDGRKNVPVGNGASSMKGVEEPIYFWDPDIGTSGMMFYTGDRFPEWKGNLFVGGLPAQYLARLVLNGERVVAEEKLLADGEAAHPRHPPGTGWAGVCARRQPVVAAETEVVQAFRPAPRRT